jgi:hypothetical protein
MKAAPRLFYLDNLRVMLTVLVIAHHVGQAYGPTGGEWQWQWARRQYGSGRPSTAGLTC